MTNLDNELDAAHKMHLQALTEIEAFIRRLRLETKATEEETRITVEHIRATRLFLHRIQRANKHE